jgi:hypothetical protein
MRTNSVTHKRLRPKDEVSLGDNVIAVTGHAIGSPTHQTT